jgi:hypothetical protein
MPNHYPNLNPEKALIWRIVHRDNLPWILDNGLHCGSSINQSPRWINIGNEDLIDRRSSRKVSLSPKGTLGDYVQFYFTPFSPMMYNISTGRGGVPERSNEEIIILVSSLPHIQELGITFMVTDSHAYYQWATFYDDLSDLDKIDWKILQQRNFARDPDDPAKFERYQAEALIHQYCPVTGLLGIVCYTDQLKTQIEQQLRDRGLNLAVHARTGWYFS